MHMLTCVAKESPIEIRTGSSDMYLVAAAKDGDHQAYAELCRRYSQQIFRTVLRITRDVADAEDTLREALLNASVHIGGFQGRSAFSSWLTRIAINSALMLSRKKRSQPVYSFEGGSDVDDLKFPEPMETSYNPKSPAFETLWRRNSTMPFDTYPPSSGCNADSVSTRRFSIGDREDVGHLRISREIASL
jgi:RNA polymerase sigma factor (sigma-70 family)